MKRLRNLMAWLGGTAIFCSLVTGVRAEYDPQGTVKKGKRWAISTGLRSGYDDNSTTASNNKHGSWFSGFNVLGRYSYPTDTSFFSAATAANGNFFADRPGSIFDFSNGVDLTFAHTFSPRLSLDLTDHFRFGQEPQLAENNTIYRRAGDFVNNGVNLGLSYQLSTKWFLDYNLAHDLWHYSDAQLKQDLERQAISTGPTLRYRVTELTTLSLGYSYGRIMYDKSPRDAETHTTTAGIMQSITRKWNASLDAGATVRKEDTITSKESHVEPFVSFGTTYLVSQKAKINAGVRHSFQETDAATFYFSKTTSSYFGFDWEFARNLSSSTSLNIVDSELANAIVTGTAAVDEWTWVVNQVFSWQVREELTLDLRYTWTRLDSPLENRSYRRNVVSVGASYLF
ncbi:MAG: hypothetical protein IT578_02205 [Verrucomicrobiae bacterium]|nr:hypothetical protein [Verrucomicrobiae bacterium]